MTRYDVTLQCKEKAFLLFKKEIESKYYNDYFKPDRILKSNNNVYTIIWDNIGWAWTYYEVALIKEIMDKLDEDDYFENGEYAYKYICIGEEESDVEIRENGAAIEELEDFYIIRTVNLPKKYEELEI